MRYAGFAALAPLLLAGCGSGGGEDFTVEVKRPIAAVFAPLAAVNVAEARPLFAGIRVDRSRPSDNELLYTIPGSDDVTSTVRLRLEPLRDGEATMIHASVDVPPVHAFIDGHEKVLSESKLETRLKQLLESTGRNLEMGSRSESDAMKLSGLLAAIAVATNKQYLARAVDLKSDPGRFLAMLTAFEGEAADLSHERDEPMTDPDSAEHGAELSQSRNEWQQEEAMRTAAAPANDLDRYDHPSE